MFTHAHPFLVVCSLPSGGVYITLPSAEVIAAVADAFSTAFSAAYDFQSDVSNWQKKAWNAAWDAALCVWPKKCHPKSKIAGTDEAQSALEAWFALDRLCFLQAGTPSSDSTQVLIAAIVTLYERFKAYPKGDTSKNSIGDSWRSEMMAKAPHVNEATWTQCPGDFVYHFEDRENRGLQYTIRETLTTTMTAVKNTGPLRWKGADKDRAVLDHSVTIDATKAVYALDARSWDMVRQLAPWTDEQVAALEAAVNDLYTAIGQQYNKGSPIGPGHIANRWFNPYVKPFLRTHAAATVIVLFAGGDSRTQAFNLVKTNLGIHQQDGRVPRNERTELNLRLMLKAGYDIDIAVWNSAAAALPDNDATAQANGYTAADGGIINEAVERFYYKVHSKSVDLWPNTRFGDRQDAWWPWMEANARTGAVQATKANWRTTTSSNLGAWQASAKSVIPDLRAMLQADGDGRRLDTTHTGPAPRPEFHGGLTLAARMLKRHLSLTTETQLLEIPELSYTTTVPVYPTGGGAHCEDPDGRTSILDVYKIRANVMRDGHKTMAVIPSPFGGTCVADWNQWTHEAESSKFGKSVLGYFLEPLPF